MSTKRKKIEMVIGKSTSWVVVGSSIDSAPPHGGGRRGEGLSQPTALSHARDIWILSNLHLHVRVGCRAPRHPHE